MNFWVNKHSSCPLPLLLLLLTASFLSWNVSYDSDSEPPYLPGKALFLEKQNSRKKLEHSRKLTLPLSMGPRPTTVITATLSFCSGSLTTYTLFVLLSLASLFKKRISINPDLTFTLVFRKG